MIKIGSFNELRIKKMVDFGFYLEAGKDEPEILLPKKYIKPDMKIGDIVNVFVYKDSEDRKIATTLIPKAVVGDFALLKVKDINNMGAFLDWGLEKDLLLPYGEYEKNLKPGDYVFVRVALDPITDRVYATSKIGKFIEKEEINLKEGEEVDLIVAKISELGVKVIINKKYTGLIYENEIFEKIEVGQKLKGFIKKIREDKKIDVTLRKKGYEEVLECKNKIVEFMKKNKGILPLNDDSSPEDIKKLLGMSKKTFKKAIGGLYKDRIIEIETKQIKLKNK